MVEADLRRQVYFLRVRLAQAEATAAEHYRLAAFTAIVVMLCGWAVLSLAISGSHWFVGGPLAVLCLIWWTANRHFERREKLLSDAVAEAREAGYSVEIMRGGIHFAEPLRP